MAQKAQIVDLTKGYIPGDANTFPQNLVNTPNEDGEEKVLPILPYEGYNFMPTSYGYRSYFGETAKLDIGTLASRPQFILLYQLPTFKSRLIALCEDGIWLCDANTPSAAWTRVVTQAFNPLILEEWTHCIIENTLYFYKQGNAVVYYTNINATPELEILSFVPSFLNMAGQMGIFKAGTRLGFWDSANSVSWSSNLDLHDFTPSLETMAGSTIFGSIVGRIMLCKAHGEGFVVYSTRSVVGVDFSVTSNLLWDAKKVLDNTGIAHSRAVVSGTNDSEHYMYGTTGIYRVGGFSPSEGRYSSEAVLPELYDYLGKSRTPITLTLLQDRFLCFSAGSSDAIYGQTAFRTVAVDSYSTIVNWYLPTSEPPTPTVVVDKPLIVEIITSITTVNPITTASKEANYDVSLSILLIGNSSKDIIHIVNPAYPPVPTLYDTSYNDLGDMLVSGEASYPLLAEYLNESKGLEFSPIHDVRPGFFSLHASSDRQRLGKLIDIQENYWVEQEITLDRYAQSFSGELASSLPYYSNSEVIGEYYIAKSFLSGKGRVEVLSSNDFLHHSADDVGNKLVLRKYFSEIAVIKGKVPSSNITSVPYTEGSPPIEDWLTEKNYARLCVGSLVTASKLYTPVHLPSTALARRAHFMHRPSNDSMELGTSYGTYILAHDVDSNPTGELSQTLQDMTEAEILSTASDYDMKNTASAGIPPSDAYNTYLGRTYNKGAIGRVAYKSVYSEGDTIVELYYYEFKKVKVNYILVPYDSHTPVTSGSYFVHILLGTGYEKIDTNTYPFTSTSYNGESSDKLEVSFIQGDFGYSDFTADLIKWDYFNPYTLDIVSSTAASTIINPPVLTPTTGGNLNNRDTWAYSIYTAPSNSYYEQANGKFGIYSIGEGIGEVQVYSTPPAANTFQIGLNSVVTVPGTNFILQTGGIDTAYPMYAGSFVFDMQLKKWGKYKGDHMLMVETTPINSSISSTITYTDLGMDAASFKGDGFLHPFSNEPADSYIKYGKLGVYRLGMTSLQEVRIHQAQASNYKVQIGSSKEGLAVTDLSDEVTYSSNMSSTTYCSVSARWHSIKISGTFDLTGLEIRTKIAGRR